MALWVQGFNKDSLEQGGVAAGHLPTPKKTYISNGEVKAETGAKKQKASWFAKLFCGSSSAAK